MRGRRLSIVRVSLSGRGGRAAWIVLLAAALGGCSIPLADIGSSGEGGPPKDTSGFPVVTALPAPRDQGALQPAERSKIQNELIAARDAQAAAAAAAAK
jgi:hypothetical protein